MAKRRSSVDRETAHSLTELQCTCALIRRSARQITQTYDGALKGVGLRITQYSILANLDGRDDVSITDLARIMVMDRTTLTRNLRPLQRDGLVRLAEGADNRSKALRVTAKGGEVLKAARPLWEKTEKSLRQSVSGEDIAQLRQLLRRVASPEGEAG
jgi:DNA-binding MarR family transcriptional regulator